MIWISLSIMICTIAVSAALLRSSKGDALGIPLVALGSFTFLYVIQPLELIRTDTVDLFLSDWQVTKALLIPALMLAAFMAGWLRPNRPRPDRIVPWDPQVMWKVGFAAAWLGLILWVIFLERSGGISRSYSEAHGGSMGWKENTAYLYDGPWLILSGAFMMIYGNREYRTTSWKTLAPYCFLAAFCADAIIGSSRGSLFAGVGGTFVAVSIARRKQVKLEQVTGFLLILACLITFVFANRSRLHFGAQGVNAGDNPEEALNGLVGTSEYDREHGMIAQEFLLQAATIEAVDQTGKLDWGVSWVEFLLINPIPRVLFPEKPTPTYGGVTSADIFEQTSIISAPGSAPGIVADLYGKFHLLSAVFMYGLGFGLRRLFLRARTFSSPLAMVGYTMIYAFSLNMFAQGFGALFVPFLYSMFPVMIFTGMSRLNRKKSVRHEKDMLLWRIATVRGERWSS
jgi:uncharacterized membrane protein